MKSLSRFFSVILLLSFQSFASSPEGHDAVLKSDTYTPNTSEEAGPFDEMSSSSLPHQEMKALDRMLQKRPNRSTLLDPAAERASKALKSRDLNQTIHPDKPKQKFSNPTKFDYERTLAEYRAQTNGESELNSMLPPPRYPEQSDSCASKSDENDESMIVNTMPLGVGEHFVGDKTHNHLTEHSEPSSSTQIVKASAPTTSFSPVYTQLLSNLFRLIPVERSLPGTTTSDILTVFGRQRFVISLQGNVISQFQQQCAYFARIIERQEHTLRIRRTQADNLFTEAQAAHDREDELEEELDKKDAEITRLRDIIIKLQSIIDNPALMSASHQEQIDYQRQQIGIMARENSELQAQILGLQTQDDALKRKVSNLMWYILATVPELVEQERILPPVDRNPLLPLPASRLSEQKVFDESKSSE